MINRNPESVGQVIDPPLNLCLASPDDGDIFREWLNLRQAHVEREGWRFGDDFDDYDADPRTLHLLMRKGESIVAGIRLTPASDPEETLSWSMLSPLMRKEAADRMPEHAGQEVWDLTRLISTSIDKNETIDALVQLFAVGLKLNQDIIRDPRWFFTTTRPLYYFFKRQGIEFTPLVQGKICPTDKHESVFCYIDPAACLEEITAQPSAHREVFAAAMKGAALAEARGCLV